MAPRTESHVSQPPSRLLSFPSPLSSDLSTEREARRHDPLFGTESMARGIASRASIALAFATRPPRSGRSPLFGGSAGKMREGSGIGNLPARNTGRKHFRFAEPSCTPSIRAVLLRRPHIPPDPRASGRPGAPARADGGPAAEAGTDHSVDLPQVRRLARKSRKVPRMKRLSWRRRRRPDLNRRVEVLQGERTSRTNRHQTLCS
jgi:hypothetical protein